MTNCPWSGSPSGDGCPIEVRASLPGLVVAVMVADDDEVAEGDPTAWCLSRLRERLPEMLELAGARWAVPL